MTPNHNKEDGANFSQRPLLRYTEQSYHLLNRSFCSEAFLESIFTQLRSKVPNFDGDYLGKGIERYVRQVLREHDIDSSSGDYWIGKTRWECDIVVETNKTIIFIEVKKKPLTRKARAGSDVSVVMDLAQSLLDAQKQAGNHEVQLRKAGYLDLLDGGNTHRIELKGRTIERIALSLTDFGSFHDRTFLEKFMNAVTQLKFGVYDKQYKNKFDDLNEVIASLQEQGRFLYPDNGEHQRPYFNCWFFSLPQLIIILDGISGPEAFRNALWAIRGITTGQGDLCFDLRYAEQMRVSNPDWYAAVLKMADSNKTFVT
jgi:Holliday junction resolvase-like predicted endonuclease